MVSMNILPPSLASADLASHANHLWEFLDEMHQRDPDEYEAFLKKQMVSASHESKAKRVEALPSPGFCLLMRLRSGSRLYVNLCSHARIASPNTTPDGSVPIAVGVPRTASPPPPEGEGLAVDVLLHPDVLSSAQKNAAYRSEIAALAAGCVKEILTTSTPSPVVSGQARGLMTHTRSGARLPEPLAPGYRELHVKYAGEAVPFVDAREPVTREEPTGHDEEMAALAKLVGSMANRPSTEGNGVPPCTPETSGALELRLPGESGDVGGARGEESARRVLVEEVSSHPAKVRTPEHEVQEVEGALKVVVKLPEVSSAAEVELELGDDALSLSAEGLYQLALSLPVAGVSTQAGCKFDKKRRILTITMPIA